MMRNGDVLRWSGKFRLNEEELMNIVGESKAQIIYNFFRDKKAEETVEE